MTAPFADVPLLMLGRRSPMAIDLRVVEAGTELRLEFRLPCDDRWQPVIDATRMELFQLVKLATATALKLESEIPVKQCATCGADWSDEGPCKGCKEFTPYVLVANGEVIGRQP